jgi:hypothetical protein
VIRHFRKGRWYWNGYDGLRVITDIDGHGHIHYVIKAAHLEIVWDSKATRVVSVINRRAKCHPRWFAIWAKAELSPEEGAKLLRVIRSRRVAPATTPAKIAKEIV